MDKGFPVSYPDADLVFVSEDTPTDECGKRDLNVIRKLVEQARGCNAPIVLTSAVPPGFTRSLGFDLYHQAETLRIIDAAERAAHPEQIIVGCKDPSQPLHPSYQEYVDAFNCPVLLMTWEEAEFAKVAINMMLVCQVDATNWLSEMAVKIGAKWESVAQALRLDARIGPKAYLTPGCWQDSQHLLRDYVTMCELSK